MLNKFYVTWIRILGKEFNLDGILHSNIHYIDLYKKIQLLLLKVIIVIILVKLTQEFVEEEDQIK